MDSHRFRKLLDRGRSLRCIPMTDTTPMAPRLRSRDSARSARRFVKARWPVSAISVGAALVRTDERISPADGVGAVLRYAPTLHQSADR